MHLSASSRFVAISLLFCLSPVMSAGSISAEPPRVMVMGMFHFANPGLDKVKNRVIDVTTAPNQAYLDGLAARLAAFKPTDVLVECSTSEQADYDQRFSEYLDGRFVLPVNENYQVGFRVARLAGLKGITCFDDRQIGWNAQPMFDYMDKHLPQRRTDLEGLFASMSASADQEQSTLSLQRLLELASDPVRDAENKALYMRTNDIGAGDGFAGADASASWWHRNFRMYANVQRAASTGRRVIALAGQGHAAILKDFLAADAQRKAEDVQDYL